MADVDMIITPEESALVQKIAKKAYWEYLGGKTKGMSEKDLYSYGIIGLLYAKIRFDRSRKIPFFAYAAIRIRGEIIDAIRKNPMIKVPQKPYEKVKVLRKAADELAESGQNADSKTLADKLDWTVSQVQTIQGLSRKVVLVDSESGPEPRLDGLV